MYYGNDIQFGYFLTPSAADVNETLRRALVCDRAGYDLIGVQDHPYQSAFLDTWTLLAFIAAQTERVRLFPDVASLPLRPPAVLAKSAATLDLMSGGRVELGLGAGAFWEGIYAMGSSRRTPGQAVTALEEAMHIIKLFWSGKRGARYQGEFYQLRGAHTGPVPAHPMGIWLGAYGPRMLELTGGWPTAGCRPHPTLRRLSCRRCRLASTTRPPLPGASRLRSGASTTLWGASATAPRPSRSPAAWRSGWTS